MPILQVDDTLHEITAHVDSTNPVEPNPVAKEQHECEGHMPKDSKRPACIRESSNRVLHSLPRT
eukprot:5285195-Amphidinium_carterae.1